ncbi:MAG: acetyltransferase [Acidimicrobiales bacterium]|nr:acetyltransferase [Acidimicrobiales bacterium]MCB9392592.1 acetyltransferase [Acidimicrobiaceae bacterium]
MAGGNEVEQGAFGRDEPAVKVVLVGAGGHARVCLEALHDDPGHQVVGAVSGDGTGVDGLPVPVLGLDADLPAVVRTKGAERVFVAIGDNAARAALTSRCDSEGLLSTVAISRHAVVSPAAVIGGGSAVLPGAVVNAAARLGRGVIVNTNASVDHDCVVGDFVHVSPRAALCGGVRVGGGTFIGAGATVVPNVTIGARAVVSPGAVVMNDVPDGAVVSGNPARSHGRVGA